MKAASSVREELQRRRGQIRQGFQSSHDAEGTLLFLTQAVDEAIREAARQLLPRRGVTMAALGGYGRAELFPASDVDLLVIHCGEQDAVRALLNRLWDLGLELGHQVWAVGDFEALDLEYLEFILALLDARFLAGDQDLAERAFERFLPTFLDRNRHSLIEQIIHLTRSRHAGFSDTVYQLEPDLKCSPGGLRDYWTGIWLERIGGAKAFLPSSTKEILDAYRFICRLRLTLHYESGRKQDRLTHGFQEKAARFLGYAADEHSSAVEALMNQYFLKAHLLVTFCRRTLMVWDPDGRRRRMDLPADADLGNTAGLLRIFAGSLEEGLPLSDKARDAVVKSLFVLRPLPEEAPPAPLLRKLLQPRLGLYRVLCEMYELGLLERLFPEFGEIKERVIRDFYHCYTVDEHTLQAVKRVEDLIQTEEASDRRFRSLLEECARPDLLVLALLLHDVGKSRRGDHARRSARMAERALGRLGFGKPDVERVTALIRDHLGMSNVVFRRDLDDPAVVAAFADSQPDVEQLRLLCLLTYADIGAVGPGVLNDWKKDLLFQLYVAAHNASTQGYGAVRIDRSSLGRRLAAGLAPDIDRRAFAQFLRGFPRRYLTSTVPQEIEEHFRMSMRLSDAKPVGIRVSRQDNHYEICVVTPDRKGLFSDIAGSLAYWDMSVQRGYGFSNLQGVVLDLFRFSDTGKRFEESPSRIGSFRDFLEGVIRGRVSVAERLEAKRKSVLHQELPQTVEPTAYFVESPDEYSILEIVAPDSLGLLYRIGREISDSGCQIELLLIATEGSKAVDVFYLTRGGGPLDAALRAGLPERILKSIGKNS